MAGQGEFSHSASTQHKGASATAPGGYRWRKANPGQMTGFSAGGHPDSLFPEYRNNCLDIQLKPCAVQFIHELQTASLEGLKKEGPPAPATLCLEPWDGHGTSVLRQNRLNSAPPLATNLWETEKLSEENAKQRKILYML